MRIPDLGWKKPGSGINIPDPQHWSQRLLLCPEQGLERAPWQAALALRSFALWPRVALSEAWISAWLGLAAGQLKT
jgi:hypothetical protein